MAVGTYAIRFSFLGLLGRRALPLWAMRLLRYTPVAVLPGLVAPMVLWPAASAGHADLARTLAALVTVALGIVTRSALAAILGGGATLNLMLYFFG